MKNDRQFIDELASAYAGHSPNSAALQQRAQNSMVDGGSHTVRLTRPFPPRIQAAHGAKIMDVDGHEIIDFWQGHYANILGHNPAVITMELAQAFARGYGLQCGFTEPVQIEVAELLCRQTGMERVRFTTSGSLATLYAVMMARAFTGREEVLKVGGGWHGGQPWGLKGVKFDRDLGFDHTEGEGLPADFGGKIRQTRFNDCQMLTDVFKENGSKLACFILEPVIGGGGFIPATREFLKTARQLADQYGVVLIFDEIISGFRFRAGDVGALYGVKPDLITLGKIIGGGMPVAAVAGSKDILDVTAVHSGPRVWFSGGTYSGHPASMLAAKTMLDYLITNESTVYPRLAALGSLARQAFIDAFRSEGLQAVSTGFNADLPASSLFILHFPHDPSAPITCPEEANNARVCHIGLTKKMLPLGLLLYDVNMLEGKGAVSLAHSETDIKTAAEACASLARRIRLAL
jgi:glutamate-1-semialdehyde 2,1-aminomutase